MWSYPWKNKETNEINNIVCSIHGSDGYKIKYRDSSGKPHEISQEEFFKNFGLV